MPSKATATRLLPALPLTMKAIAFPLAQPPRLTICWTTAERSGVRSASRASPSVVHGGGAQETDDEVKGRAPTLLVPVVKGTALSDASPWIVSEVVSLFVSSTWNWIQAAWIAAPAGIARPAK